MRFWNDLSPARPIGWGPSCENHEPEAIAQDPLVPDAQVQKVIHTSDVYVWITSV